MKDLEWWQYRITYDIVTPESAVDGDVSERGFVGQYGDIEMEDGIVGDDARRWFEERHDSITFTVNVEDGADPVDALGKILRAGGFTERSGRSFYESGSTNMYDGSERTECVHVSEAWTESELKELERIANNNGG